MIQLTEDWYKVHNKDNESRKRLIALYEKCLEPDYNKEGYPTQDAHLTACCCYAIDEHRTPDSVRGDKGHKANKPENIIAMKIVDHIESHGLELDCCDERYRGALAGAYDRVKNLEEVAQLSLEDQLRWFEIIKEEASKRTSNFHKDSDWREDWERKYKEAMANPSHSENLRAATTSHWKDEEYRSRVIKSIRVSHNTESYKEKMREALKNVWTPEKRNYQSVNNAMKDPEVKAKHLEAVRKMASTPEWREKVSAANKASHNTTEYKAKMSAVMKEVWSDPKRVAAFSGKNNPMANPEIRAKCLAINVAAHNTPEYKAALKVRNEEETKLYGVYKSNGGKLPWNAWRHFKKPSSPLPNEDEILPGAKMSWSEEQRAKFVNPMANPEIRAKCLARSIASHNTPEYKAKASSIVKAALATPEHKEKRRAQTEREHNAYVAYQSNGGSLKWNAWRHAGQPTHD